MLAAMMSATVVVEPEELLTDELPEPVPVRYRDPRNGRPTVAKICPSCSRRFAGLVDPDCIICQGRGLLLLGAAAVEQHGAEQVSLAVEIVLEKLARHSLAEPQTPLSTS